MRDINRDDNSLKTRTIADKNVSVNIAAIFLGKADKAAIVVISSKLETKIYLHAFSAPIPREWVQSVPIHREEVSYFFVLSALFIFVPNTRY